MAAFHRLLFWSLLALQLLINDVCQSQARPPVNSGLPQDPPREMQPALRLVPVVIDRDRHAEQPPAGAESLSFRLVAIDLMGNQALSTKQFEPLWAEWVGKEIQLSRVFEIAARISAAYRDAGYVLSQAMVPQQQIVQDGGRVRIRVAEGYISRITFASNFAGKERVEAMLRPILLERPLTLRTLERRLLLLNDLPGLSARASLRTGEEANAADMELVVERDLNAFSLSVHNRTNAAVGPTRLEAFAERRAALGNFDRHVLRWVGSGNERLNLLAYSGDAPMGYSGTQVQWSASASRSKPSSGEVFKLDTRSENLSLGISHPLVRSRDTNLGLRASLSGYNGSSDLAQGIRLSEERLRLFRVGLTADQTDRLGGINLLDVEFAKGLTGLGASKEGDPLVAAGRNPQFSKSTLYLARLQSLFGDVTLLLAGTAQASSDLLPSSEQFGLGGDVFLRAYDPSELLGDKGSAGKLELRFDRSLGRVAGTFYAYYDEGSVRLSNFDGSVTRDSASAVGLGLRLSAPGGIKGYIEIAKPRNRPTARNRDDSARGFAGLGIDF